MLVLLAFSGLSAACNLGLLFYLYHIRKRAPLTTDAAKLLAELSRGGALLHVQCLDPQDFHIRRHT